MKCFHHICLATPPLRLDEWVKVKWKQQKTRLVAQPRCRLQMVKEIITCPCRHRDHDPLLQEALPQVRP